MGTGWLYIKRASFHPSGHVYILIFVFLIFFLPIELVLALVLIQGSQIGMGSYFTSIFKIFSSFSPLPSSSSTHLLFKTACFICLEQSETFYRLRV